MGTDPSAARSEETPMATTKSYRHLHDRLVARPGAEERLAALREETLADISLFDLRRALGLSQTAVADDLHVSQSAVSQFERAGDMRLSTLRRYLAHLGAELHLVAVFDKDGRDHGIEFHVGDE